MADYIMKSEWEDVDAAAMSLKSGDTLLASNQARKNSTMTEPVGVDESGKLFVRPPGEGGGGGGTINYPPATGIPAEDLSEDVREKLTEQIVYNFATPTAYEDFFNRYGDDLKRGDIVIILDTDGNGKTVVYQLGKNSLDPLELTPVMELQLSSGTNAVIWATNVAPTSRRFIISDLTGPSGAVPYPGHMIVSSYTGRGYFIIDAGEDAVTVSDHTVQVTGSAGAPGSKGDDGGYYTIDVEQLNSTTVKLSFVPSKEGMETILPEVITLPQGPKGATPVRGTDYWTAADIAEIKSYVDEAILGGAW
mgnify:CR=1 FL=1